MHTFKFVVLICVVLAICQANPLTRNDAHNIYNCPVPADATKVLVNEPVYESAGFLQIKKKIYKFPKEGVNANLIKCISIQDKANDGTGAYPTIVSGGLDQYYIEIEFTSQRGKSINFNVELFSSA